MTRRWIPFIATTAALALACVSPAQDRSRGESRTSSSSRSSGGGDRPSRSRGSDHRSDSRSSDSRGSSQNRSGNSQSGGSRSDSRTGSQGDARPTRTADSKSVPDRDSRNDPLNSRNRSGGSGGVGGGGNASLDRRNPFERSERPSSLPRERPTIGTPTKEYRRNPSYYDGRGRVQETHYSAAPTRSFLGVQIRRTDVHTGYNVAFGGQFGGLRVGYVSYSSGFRRNSFGYGGGFGYPYYCYDPFAPDYVVVASPWYRYSYLPPYIDHTRVIVVNDYPSSWAWDGWRTYDYRSDRRNEALRDALDDLKDAFEDNSDRIANRLVPLEGDIAIYNDGHYDYSLNPDDFQKMFLDGVDQSKTTRYEILEVRTQGDEVRVRARHEYEDSWGNDQSVVHMITLRRDHGGDYVIREFGTE